MQTLVVKSPAKINLTFEILGTLPGGYHEVSTLLQTIDLADILRFEFSPADQLDLSISCNANTNSDDFPLDNNNLIARAARLLLQNTASVKGVKCSVKVEKNVPIGAGLAGGSGNAAATLKALNHYLGNPISDSLLLKLAAELGADVPFCLSGGTCIGRARGDQLSNIEQACPLVFCVIKPKGLSLSTAWVYQVYDRHTLSNNPLKTPGKLPSENNLPDAPGLKLNHAAPNTESAAHALLQGDIGTAINFFGNVFETPVFQHHPELAKLKQHILDLGAWTCHLSGSGPALFALVSDLPMAHQIRRRLLDTLPENDLEVHIATSVNHGVKIVEAIKVPPW